MPIYAMRCLNGHQQDVYAHSLIERQCQTAICACGEGMSQGLSMGRGLTYFAEGGKGRWIENLGDKPVFVTSAKQHEDLMKAAGVTWATPRRGMPGQWS